MHMAQARLGGILGSREAVDVEDPVDSAYTGQQGVQMLRVRHFKDELAGGHAVTAGRLTAGEDVHPVIGQYSCHIREQMRSVQGFHDTLTIRSG